MATEHMKPVTMHVSIHDDDYGDLSLGDVRADVDVETVRETITSMRWTVTARLYEDIGALGSRERHPVGPQFEGKGRTFEAAVEMMVRDVMQRRGDIE